ncbi:Hypothetical YciO protein, TsaC/YrdC paralog [hydrothermal vent metagenome]|uniref:Hypothetical YciO protein, TsaC/YrdC paralog n=1 Tax=hydrothermal vent metagenome TaxID=652676 RepID=A0A3B0YEM5_9ZZZZ
MTQRLVIHNENPQLRLIRQVITELRQGGLIIYPTDSSYALGCLIGNKEAMEQMRRIRQLDNKHNFTLMCRDLSEIAIYAKVSNQAYRLMKSITPGAYTFILKATHEVPRRLQNPKRKTIGLRVPQHTITQSLLQELGEPIMSSTLLMAGDTIPLNDIDDIYDSLHKQVAMIIDGGSCGFDLTTVIDLEEEAPVVMREGKGPLEVLGLQ